MAPSYEENITVGWIAPMALELEPAIAILENHKKISKNGTPYHVGQIGTHRVVMTVCPRIGTEAAARAVERMTLLFPTVKHILVVGIAGGTPEYGPDKKQIVLGDVVVSCPRGNEGGVADYNAGAWQGKSELNHSGHRQSPSDALLAAVNNLRSEGDGKGMPNILRSLRCRLGEDRAPNFDDPGPEHDFLFPDDYPHLDKRKACDECCEPEPRKRRSQRGEKAKREKDSPHIHYGIIGSGDTLMVSSEKRNELYETHEIICFEMESAGVMGGSQALVIRGISDYADSHKNKKWQEYAAATAACYGKELLLTLPPDEIVPHLREPELQPEPAPQILQGCLRSLAFPQMYDRCNDISQAAQGTCEWILRHHKYRGWATDKRGLLWIKGKPGSGKSTLLKYALRHCEAEASDIVLSFFFHDRGNEFQKTPLGLYRSLLHQLLSKVPIALSDLVNIFEERQSRIGKVDEKWQWHHNELQNFFTTSLQKVPDGRSVWLFVDALDECGEENAVNLFEWLEDLASVSSQIRICVACRHYPILDANYELKICPEEENQQDIDTYVRAQISTKRSPDLASSPIPNLIVRRASGLFMWAFLVVKQVLALDRTGETLQRIEEEIYKIPQGLHELYQDLIRNMNLDSLKLIEWICFATRPLTLDELRWALVIGAEDNCSYRSLKACQNSRYYQSDDTKIKRRVETLSCGLAEVVPSSTGEDEVSVVQFIHQSVKDFFIDNNGLLFLHDSIASIDAAIGMAHYRLSRVCIIYLAMEEIGQSNSFKQDDFPFLHYATTSWVAHTKQCDDRGIAQNDLLELFAWPSNDLVARWVRVYNAIAQFSPDCPPPGTTLVHVLSRYNILRLLKTTLDQNNSECGYIDAKDEYGRTGTPLSQASENGHSAVVRLLLDTGKVDVDAKDEDSRTPLSWASENGHSAIVRLLLDTGKVDIDAKDEIGCTPLSWASENGHLAIVRLLLDTGKVDIDAKDKDGCTPLSWASLNGHSAVVRLLLATGKVDIDVKGEIGCTPLSWASRNGHSAVVRLLLATGKVDIDAKDEIGCTPLSWASRNGHSAVVRLLLDMGKVDIDAKDEIGCTPLSWASGEGHSAVVKLLLDTGKVDVDAKDEDGYTPLSWASKNGHSAVVRLLLATGKVDVDAKDEHSRTPLSWASRNGHSAVVRLLLDTGKVDINAKDEIGRTSLSRASKNGHSAVVRLLLATGKVDIDAKDEDGCTPLSRASKNGHSAVVRLLLDMGKVDIDAKDEIGCTLLSWASGEGHEAVVRLFMADINAENKCLGLSFAT